MVIQQFGATQLIRREDGCGVTHYRRKIQWKNAEDRSALDTEAIKLKP